MIKDFQQHSIRRPNLSTSRLLIQSTSPNETNPTNLRGKMWNETEEKYLKSGEVGNF